MWKLSYAVNIGNKKTSKKQGKNENGKSKKRKKSTFHKSIPTKQPQEVRKHVNTSEWESNVEEPILEFDESESGEETNNCNVSYKFPKQSVSSENNFFQPNHTRKNYVSQPHTEAFADVSKNMLQISDVLEHEQIETVFDCFKENRSSSNGKSLKGDINKSSDIFKQKVPHHSPDENDLFGKSNVCLPSTSKCIFIATENDIYVQSKLREEGENSPETTPVLHTDELNTSCNEPPRRTGDIKLDNSNFHDDNSFTVPLSSSTNTKHVFVATESVIYFQNEARHLIGTSETDIESHADELNPSCNDLRNGTFNIKSNNSSPYDGDQLLTSPRYLQTTSENVFIATENAIYVKTKSRHDGETLVKTESESHANGENRSSNAIPSETFEFESENSHFPDYDQSLISPRYLPATSKHVFVATDSIIYVKTQAKQNGETLVDLETASNVDGQSSLYNEIPNGTFDVKQGNSNSSEDKDSLNSPCYLPATTKSVFTATGNVIYVETAEGLDSETFVETVIESHAVKFQGLGSEIPNDTCDAIVSDISIHDVANENIHDNLQVDNIGSNIDQISTEMESQADKQLTIQKIDIEYADQLSAFPKDIGDGALDVVNKDTLMLNVTDEKSIESKSLPRYENLLIDNVYVELLGGSNYTNVESSIHKNTQERKIEGHPGNIDSSSTEVTDSTFDVDKTSILRRNVTNENLSESKLILYQENLTNGNVNIQSTCHKNSIKMESLTCNSQNTQETKIKTPADELNSLSTMIPGNSSVVSEQVTTMHNVTSKNYSESKTIPHKDLQAGNANHESMDNKNVNKDSHTHNEQNMQETKIKIPVDELSPSSKEVPGNSSVIMKLDISMRNVNNENLLESKPVPYHENLPTGNVDIRSTGDKSFTEVKSQTFQVQNIKNTNNALSADRQDSGSVVKPDIIMQNVNNENMLESKNIPLHENSSSDKMHVESMGDKSSNNIKEVKVDSDLNNTVPVNQSNPANPISKLESVTSKIQISSVTSITTSNCKSDPNNTHETKKILKTSRHSECNLYDYDPRISKLPLKIYSKDRKEYIKKKLKDGQLLYSSKFIEKLSGTELVIRIHGPDNFLTLNKDSFAARIMVRNKEMLNFGRPLETNKLNFLKRITIMKILEDESLDRRNEIYKQFKEILQDRVNRATDHADCTEDLLQLSNICCEMLKRKSLRESRIVLNEIIKSKYISTRLKELAEQFLIAENNLRNRNKYLPRFHTSVSPVIKDFLTELHNIYKLGIINHKNNLLKKYPYRKFKSMFQLLDINYLPDIILLSLNGNDIKLFAELVTIANQQNESPTVTIPPEYIANIWNNFYIKIKELPKYESIKLLGSLTSPIYIFLFKSFCELITEIGCIIELPPQNLLKNDSGKFSTLNSLNWPKNTPINRALEQQYHLIFKLMEHFEPGKYSNKSIFKYTLQLKNFKNKTKWQKIIGFFKTEEPGNISEERLVWLYILDSGLAHIMPDGDTNEHVQKLTHSVQSLFAKFLENVQHDRHETFRIVVQNITKFVGHISTYISKMDSVASTIDHKILDKQIEFISSILNDSNGNAVVSQFANLMDVYKEYWKNRESIVERILSKCPCKTFEDVIKKDIFLRLLEIVDEAQCKNVTMQIIIQYFRLYNEFLQHLKGIEFEWLVSKKYLLVVSSRNYVKVIKAEKEHYRVTNPEEFVRTLKAKKACIPENYLITVVKELLGIVTKSLNKQNWTEFEQVKAAGDLFLAIGHSLIHFKGQANYVDFENFVKNCTLPFNDVLINSEKYRDFKNRLDNVENFYLYTNKQNEIGIDNALNLCVENSGTNINKDFVTNIDQSILKECYNKYSIKIASLGNYLETSDTDSIIADMRKDLENISPIDEWTSEFKQNVIPSLLANLAAVWIITESEDLGRIGKRIEPHIIQILCIFRLLGVDKKSNGIDKHLAQVLTGQGKSIVLGLLSSLLAVTGHKSIIACYSDYLANRDEDAFRHFFDILSEFGVKEKVSYLTIDHVVDEFLYQNINGRGRSLRSLASDLILDKLQTTFIVSDRISKCSVLLIDEVDVFFSDTFYGNLYSPVCTVRIPALLKIQPKIWEIAEESIHDKDIILEKIMGFINEILKDDKYEEFKDFIENSNNLFKKHLEEMVLTAIDVSGSKASKNSFSYRYKINPEGMITYRKSDGMYVTTIYNNYYNMFNYFFLKEADFEHKYYGNYGYLLVECGCVSYANLPTEFPVILGVSGTLTTLRDFEKSAIKSYGIDTISIMPSFFGDRKLKFNSWSDCVLKATESEWLDSIYDSVNDKIQHGRAIIVFFETEHEMKLFDEKFRSRIDRLHKLTGNEESSTLEWYISESGVAQTVTLATRLMGRGVDFKSNDLSVEEKGGVHVIQSFFSLDVKEEVQIQGRTSRKDNKGSYELILCHQHLAKINCLKKADGTHVGGYNELCEVRKKTADSEGALVKEKLKIATKKHDLTMKFLKSFADYTSSKRLEYLSRYPFVELEE